MCILGWQKLEYYLSVFWVTNNQIVILKCCVWIWVFIACKSLVLHNVSQYLELDMGNDLSILAKWTVSSSVANPICQEGQSERTFPIFAFSSRFSLFFPDFSRFFCFFLLSGVALCPPWPPVATPLTVSYPRGRNREGEQGAWGGYWVLPKWAPASLLWKNWSSPPAPSFWSLVMLLSHLKVLRDLIRIIWHDKWIKEICQIYCFA